MNKQEYNELNLIISYIALFTRLKQRHIARCRPLLKSLCSVKLLLLQPCTLMEEEEDLSVVPARFGISDFFTCFFKL
jgi:hypothetical protein